MADLKVNRIGSDAAPQQAQQIEEAQKRVHLFTHSKFESSGPATFAGIGRPDLSAVKASSDDSQKKSTQQPEEVDEVLSVKLTNGKRLELPRLSKEERAEIQRILSQVPGEKRARLERLAVEVAWATYAELESNPEGVKLASYSAGLSDAGRNTYEGYVTTVAQVRQEEAVHGSILLGLHGMEQNLHDYFGKVQREQQIAAEIRTDVAELESALADWPDDGSTESFDYHEVVFNEDGTISVIEHTGVEMTKQEAQALLDKLKGQVDSLGQFDSMSMFRLQFMVNRHKEGQTVISNIMKQAHETQKGILSNIR